MKKYIFIRHKVSIESALDDDRSRELAMAVHEADEFEWYYGIKETEERLQELSIRRRGYASEALRVMLSEAFVGRIIETERDGLAKIIASVRQENEASRLLL